MEWAESRILLAVKDDDDIEMWFLKYIYQALGTTAIR